MYYPHSSYPYHRPSAVAYIHGNDLAPDLEGIVYFQQDTGGVLVTACLNGMCNFPITESTSAQISPIASLSRTNNTCDLGNLSVVFSNKDFVYMQAFADNLEINEVLNHSFIIHQFPTASASTTFGTSKSHLAYGVIE